MRRRRQLDCDQPKPAQLSPRRPPPQAPKAAAASKESQNGGGSGGGKPSTGGLRLRRGTEPGPADERSSSFRTPGGDNSIQEYGDEAGAEERAKATKTITTFFSRLQGRRMGEGLRASWRPAPSPSSNSSPKQNPKLKANGCTGVLGLVYSSAPSAARPDTIKGGGDQPAAERRAGFALYHGIDGKGYAFPLTLENGEWKLTSMGPTPLSF